FRGIRTQKSLVHNTTVKKVSTTKSCRWFSLFCWSWPRLQPEFEEVAAWAIAVPTSPTPNGVQPQGVYSAVELTFAHPPKASALRSSRSSKAFPVPRGVSVQLRELVSAFPVSRLNRRPRRR